MKCEYCPYYWQETEYDPETGEYWELEPRESCHFNPDEMMGIPAPCEEEADGTEWC